MSGDKETLDDMEKAKIREELNGVGWDATDEGVDYLWSQWHAESNT